MEIYKAMMSDQEIKIIEGLLKPDFDCLEFGSGYSTAYFNQFVKSWTSIEHDWEWFSKVQKMKGFINSKNLLIRTSERNYLKAVRRLDEKFDFILIDGILRRECLEMSFNFLKPNGVVLLHDASRFEYNDWINDFEGEMLTSGEMPDPDHKGYYLIRGLKLYYGNHNQNQSKN